MKCGNVQVFGSCGLTVHKSINPYVSLFNTCEYMITSSSSMCSAHLLKLILTSSFP